MPLRSSAAIPSGRDGARTGQTDNLSFKSRPLSLAALSQESLLPSRKNIYKIQYFMFILERG
jgi:hypothetical protein